ncbi:PBS lyase [Spirochaetia bacterium]|nr:PBS lyase [Spirochaetia bacterium]
MKRILITGLFLLAAVWLFAQEDSGEEPAAGTVPAAAPASTGTASSDPAAKTVEAQRLETIRYGTETEIAALIQTLKSEKVTDMDDELVTLVQGTLNRSILTGVFTFFGDREQGGLEDRALRAITDWDDEANETITAAIDYLGKLKSAKALAPLKKLLNTTEQRYVNTIFRALGRIGGGNQNLADETAEYLMDYYADRIVADESRREIITAIGETGSRRGLSFLTDIGANTEERLSIRMAALDSLSKIGDNDGLQVILEGVSSADPNLRAAAIAALGPFSGAEVDHALLEAFRDTYYRTRIGAAQAAGKRKFIEAIPYLGYRAERDDVPIVKDEAIRALGAIGNGESLEILGTLFGNRKNTDQVRIRAAEMLMREKPDSYAAKVIAEADDAQKRHQTSLYNGLLRVISTAKTQALEEFARRLLSSGGVIEKSFCLDMIVNNGFQSLLPQVEELLDPKNGSLSRKARITLDTLRGTN